MQFCWQVSGGALLAFFVLTAARLEAPASHLEAMHASIPPPTNVGTFGVEKVPHGLCFTQDDVGLWSWMLWP